MESPICEKLGSEIDIINIRHLRWRKFAAVCWSENGNFNSQLFLPTAPLALIAWQVRFLQETTQIIIAIVAIINL